MDGKIYGIIQVLTHLMLLSPPCGSEGATLVDWFLYANPRSATARGEELFVAEYAQGVDDFLTAGAGLDIAANLDGHCDFLQEEAVLCDAGGSTTGCTVPVWCPSGHPSHGCGRHQGASHRSGGGQEAFAVEDWSAHRAGLMLQLHCRLSKPGLQLLGQLRKTKRPADQADDDREAMTEFETE